MFSTTGVITYPKTLFREDPFFVSLKKFRRVRIADSIWVFSQTRAISTFFALVPVVGGRATRPLIQTGATSAHGTGVSTCLDHGNQRMSFRDSHRGRRRNDVAYPHIDFSLYLIDARCRETRGRRPRRRTWNWIFESTLRLLHVLVFGCAFTYTYKGAYGFGK